MIICLPVLCHVWKVDDAFMILGSTIGEFMFGGSDWFVHIPHPAVAIA